MVSIEEVLEKLRSKAIPGKLEAMARFGIQGQNRLGVSIPDLRELSREIGKDHQLALDLWRTGIEDARILASMVDVPDQVTELQLEEWANDFHSWDVCDQVCMNLFENIPLARGKIEEWAEREGEFVKRTAFSLIACLAWHDRQAADEEFIGFLKLIKAASTDKRNFVKKSVNWALRNIGKRNPNLNRIALDTALEIKKMESRSARWIAADAIRELSSDAVWKRLAKQDICRV